MRIEVMEPYEKELIDLMMQQKLKPSYSAVSVLIYSRNYARPHNELVALLKRLIPNLSEAEIDDAVQWLINNNLIMLKKVQEQYYIYEVVQDYTERLSKLAGNPEINKRLLEIKNKKREKVYIRYLGNVSSGDNYETLLSSIKNARFSIKYPMLDSAPYPALVETLKYVAKKGINIKILLAEDRIVKKYKGNTRKGRIEDWKKALYGIPNIVIKGFNEDETTELCTSILIDEKQLRFVLYDPETVTSLDGKLLEVMNLAGQNINLIKWFNMKFDKAWSCAARYKYERILRRIFSLSSLILLIFLCSVLYLLKFYGYNALFDQIDLLVISPSCLYLLPKIYKYIKKQFLRFKIALDKTES